MSVQDNLRKYRASPKGRATLARYARGEKAKTLISIWQRSPRGRFNVQRQHAQQRGIPWELTFEQWVAWWGDDYAQRGRRADDLVMARHGDVGPYALGNIYKATQAQNRKDSSRGLIKEANE